MLDWYWVEAYPNFGSERRFKTERDINQVISEYEVMGDLVRVETPDHEEVYRSRGLTAFLKRIKKIKDKC